MMVEIERTKWHDWHGCYDGGWQGLIVPDAFSHPAKFSYRLISRIIQHGLKSGYWSKGDLIGDPFGGVALGGIVAAYAGLNWIGVELEPRFVELGNRNLELHGPKWMVLDEVSCVKLVQGDSRRFAEVVGEVAGVVTSPPYADSFTAAADDPAVSRLSPQARAKLSKSDLAGRNYGHSPGQIGKLPAGQLEGVVTSPPYVGGGHHADQTGAWNTNGRGQNGRGQGGYGSAEGQIGNDSGETYWQAMQQVYSQCRLAIRPGGMMAVVVKDYVKNKKRVPLCDQTCQLLEHVGFQVIERCRAWLTKETNHAGLFGTVTKRKERKSFFRRLAEAKGSPRIDWEEVLWVKALECH